MIEYLKLQILLKFYIFKKHIEGKAKRRWYYNHLPARTAKAFTLAEVLITLTILGVVAALTIPALISNINNQNYVISLQKESSDLTQAANLLKLDYAGDLSNGPFGGSNSHNDLKSFATKLSVVKDCAGSSGCWHTGAIKMLDGSSTGYNPDNDGRPNAILNNGATISFTDYGSNCNNSRGDGPLSTTCGYIIVDVNGLKGPNTFGRDEFMFWIAKTGLFPFGTYNASFGNCIPSDSQGCAGKVLKEEAENY